MALSFKIASADRALMEIAARRASRRLKRSASLDVKMDLTATHANGCTLDFAKLLTFDDFSFMHDIEGIHKNLDRETGKLRNNFLPRCSK